MKLFRRREAYVSLAMGSSIGLVVGIAAEAVTDDLGRSVAFASAVTVGITLVLLRRWIRRALVLRKPAEPELQKVLYEYVGFYRRLEPEKRVEFEKNVRCMLAEYHIAGIRGAEVSYETRVLVAASAAILVFGREDLDLPSHMDVIVYPTAFNDEYESSRKGNILGQVHAQGPVIFSEKALREGFKRASDGENVGIHEFAHLLDLDVGQFDGVPTGMPWNAAAPWLSIVQKEIGRIRKHRSVLREYGATNEAEFFAVSVESFFERPVQLKEKHPALYDALKDYFGLDPAANPHTWVPPAPKTMVPTMIEPAKK